MLLKISSICEIEQILVLKPSQILVCNQSVQRCSNNMSYVANFNTDAFIVFKHLEKHFQTSSADVRNTWIIVLIEINAIFT